MADQDESPKRDRPWLIRTYSGHSSARASNELYRTNLAKGQTGLSVAFDLPTQTGYDPDDRHASGEVGKVGVPVPHLGEMRVLFEGIPLDEMNTSMTINATAMWLLGMYLALADEQGVPYEKLSGTTQNDILKEYLSRGTYIFPPEASKRLTVDLIAFTVKNVPAWNPINVCPYHLQEAGATPVQELAYGLANAIAVLDAVRDSGQVPPHEFHEVVGRTSFFIDAGVRFVEEMCKMRAFTEMWDRICLERYGVTDPKMRRFRYGMQVNSLGLTEEQPENNVQRIVLEMLGVTLSKGARARAVQLPCWNEALGLPTPWDQQWSLRIQQVLAYESDLLEYEDLFDGSKVVAAKVAELCAAAEVELQRVLDGGGSFAMIDDMKSRLVQSHAERVRRIESGELQVVGVNSFTETEPSPLAASAQLGGIVTIDREVEGHLREALARWREPRDNTAVDAALARLRAAAATTENLVPATIELAAGGRHRRRMGADPARRVGRVPRADRCGRGRDGLGREHPGDPRADPGDHRGLGRAPDPPPRGQARARRPLQRRRADRGRGPGRRDGGRLPGNPPEPGGDRGRGPRRGCRRGGALDPLRIPSGPGARDPGGAPGGRGRRARGGRWHHP